MILMKNNLQNTAPIKHPISGCYFYTQKQLEKENKYEKEIIITYSCNSNNPYILYSRHNAANARHERLLGTSSDVAPILWQHGAYARLKKHEKIDRLLYDGYSTISLGYAGLYECVKFMTGHSNSDEGIGEEFGLKVMQALNDKCNQWKTLTIVCTEHH